MVRNYKSKTDRGKVDGSVMKRAVEEIMKGQSVRQTSKDLAIDRITLSRLQKIHKKRIYFSLHEHHPRHERYIHLRNPNLMDLTIDCLYHISLSKGVHPVREMFEDVKYVCMASTPDRVEKFAHMVREDLDIMFPVGATLCDIAIRSFRYSMYKAGPVLCVSHGMGISSLSVVLHEILKLLFYAKCTNVTFIRMGFCGGLDMKTGSLIITDEVVDGMLKPYLKLDVLGRTIQRQAVLDKEIANELQTIAEEEIRECKSYIGKTMCTCDFFEGQARLDGAFCEYTRNEKLAYLQNLHSKKITNIEMETLAFAAMCHHAGAKCAAVSVVLLDRLIDDQIQLSSEIVEVYKDRPLRLVSKFLRKRIGSCLYPKKT